MLFIFDSNNHLKELPLLVIDVTSPSSLSLSSCNQVYIDLVGILAHVFFTQPARRFAPFRTTFP